MSLLEVRNLYVGFAMYHTFYRRRIGYGVEDLTLTAEPGEILGIVGASGSGQSLLAHAIMDLLPRNAVRHGEILFKGEPVAGKRVLELRRKSFALVPQSISFLDPLLKVKHQLRTGPTPDEEELARIAERLDLSPRDLEKYPFQLSGGMARRILLATAILSPAELIIADEPTPGLSVKLAEQLLADFRSLADQGRCVLIISHDVDLISAVADRVAVLNRGRLVACMPTREFTHPDDFDQPPYVKALWKALPQNEFCTEIPDSREEPTRADS